MKRKFDVISRFGILTVGITTFRFAGLVDVANSPGTFVPYNERHARRRKCGGYPWLALSAKDKTFMRKAAKG